MPHHRRFRWLVAVIPGVLVVALPGLASAATLRVEPGEDYQMVVYRAGAEANRLTLTHTAIAGDVVVDDPGTNRISARLPDCVAVMTRGVCSRVFARNPTEVHLGGGNDRATVTRVHLFAGIGNDSIVLHAGYARGDEGDDVLTIIRDPSKPYVEGVLDSDVTSIDGGPGRDVLAGGPDSDMIYAEDGEVDQVTCGGGGDVVYADPVDVIDPDCSPAR